MISIFPLLNCLRAYSAMAIQVYNWALLISFLFQFSHLSWSQSFIGINYGQVADNLPSPDATAKLLQTTSISKVRIYGTDPVIIKALANTEIGIMVGVSNGDIPAMATDPNFSKNWVNSNVIPFYPASKIIQINIGNEVLLSGDQNLMTQLLPAMQNLQNALDEASLGGKIKVSTVHSMAVLKQSDPPSSGLFDPSYGDLLKGLLGFNSATGSPFVVNPYPFFAYQSDPRPETLAFCLFQPNEGRVDSGTKIKYTNMFDAQVDAVRSALDAMGFKGVEILVAETGWPYKGDNNEVGPSLENAKAYNGNLIAHLKSMVGTPLMPGKSVDTYLFALYDEDLKPGPGSERSFGLFKPDLTMTYDAGLLKSSQSSQAPSSTRKTPVTPTGPSPRTKQGAAAWCVPKADVSEAQLQTNLDYACGQGIDCSPIQPGGACFEPNTVASHATYAMNLLFQSLGKDPWNCDFSQTATLSSNNPSLVENLASFFLCPFLQATMNAITLVERSERIYMVGVALDETKLLSPPSVASSNHSSPGKEAFSKVVRSWASKKFMSGCVILFPITVTFYITRSFIHFLDVFSPVYDHLGINVMGLGFITSLIFIFLVGVFTSSWLGASVLSLGEWIIKKMPLISYIYSASKQISAAISPDKSSHAFKEVAIIRHPRIGEYAFGFITSSVLLRRNGIDEEVCCVYVPTNHLYLGDIFLINSKDIMRPNLSVREGIEIVISGGTSVPKKITAVDAEAIPISRLGIFNS
ncbi:hypothetical protein M9H77_24843 [Catharanthus roseus]|uniref:Uncharacterized protein n=1 Tax=Catharanthus roseus TaxID=4058 RepID=A0ACC0A593_CATRO|nr:hypothetical protein M9H77_24843 [Catharanthus roseus]